MAWGCIIIKGCQADVSCRYTFNEPNVICGQVAGYPLSKLFSVSFNESLTRSRDGTLPVNVTKTTAPYTCAYNLLKAHAAAVKGIVTFPYVSNSSQYSLVFRELKIQGEISFKNDDFA
jgi:hypothetical protein